MYANGSFSLFGNDAAIYRDMYRDAYGFRPRGDYIFTSIEDVDDEFNQLQKMIEISENEEKINSDNGFKALLNDIARLQNHGAKSPRHALKWLLNGMNLRFNRDDILFLLHRYDVTLHNEYENKLKKHVGNF